MKTLALTLSSLSLFVLTGLTAEAKEPLIPKVSTIKVKERTKKAKAKHASEISREGIRAPLQGIASVKESGFRVAYQPTDDPTFKEVQERYKASRAFETITAEINESLVLPGVLDVQMASCGIPNAFYDPSGGRIIMCYELVTYFIEVFTESGLSGEELDKAVHGAVLFTFYHEIGHSLVDVLELPITGREEDAVDQLATVVLVNEGESGAQMALAGAKWFLIESDKEKDDEMVFWAVHSLHKQRYFDISCMVYGFAPHTFGDLVGSKGIPRGRAMRCPSQYQRIERSWGKLLAPHTRSESESPEEDAPRESDEVAKAEESKPAAGDAAETMEDKCAKVYDHIISLMKSAGASESDIEAMQRERSSNLRECLHDLKTEPKTEALIDCMLKAATIPAFELCVETHESEEPAPKTTDAPPSKPSPSASPDLCEATIDHVITVLFPAQLKSLPAEEREAFERAGPEAIKRLREEGLYTCRATPWTPEQQACVVKSKSFDEADGCFE